MKKTVCVLLSAVLALSLAGCGNKSSAGNSQNSAGNNSQSEQAAGADDGKVYEMKCSTFVNSGSPEMALIDEFVANVAERTDNHVIIKVYAGEQLGGYEQTFEETMRGTIEFGVNSPAASFDNRLSSTSLTGVFDSFDTVEKVCAPGSTLYRTYDEAMDGLGLKFLGFFIGGYYNLCLNVDPPANYADPNVAKDTVIRVNTWEVTDRVVSAMGYRTATLPGSELYTGLETGIVDGCIGLDYAFVLSGFTDVLTNIVETRTLLSCDSIFMNKKLFESLPEEYQKAVEECSAEFQQACIDHQRDLESSVKPQLEEKGVHIIELTQEEQDALNAKLRESVWPWYAEQFGQDFMDGIVKDAGIQ